MKPMRSSSSPTKSSPPPNIKGKPPTPPTKGKEKMPLMDRQIPDPRKQMRQKQAAEAKRLATDQRQRSGLLKEHGKIREAEAAEKAANAERIKTSRTEEPSGDAANKNDQLPQNSSGEATITEEQQPDQLTGLPATQVTGDTAPQGPTGTHTEDPEILLDKVTPPEGDVTKLSQYFTLSEEGEGDNIKGNKELRNEGDDEDENNSKRAKVPLQKPRNIMKEPQPPQQHKPTSRQGQKKIANAPGGTPIVLVTASHQQLHTTIDTIPHIAPPDACDVRKEKNAFP